MEIYKANTNIPVAVGLGKHNKCRNPDGRNGVWCFTTHPLVKWDYCAVRQCVDCDASEFAFSYLKSIATF